MPVKISSLIPGLALFFILLSACQKDNGVIIETNTDLITKSSWRFSNATVSGTDVSSSLQSCQKDNILTFVSNGTGTVDEGPAKCNAGDPQTNSINWSFQSGETQLFISTLLFTGGSGTFMLISLTDTQLILSQTITVSGTPQNVVVTFIH